MAKKRPDENKEPPTAAVKIDRGLAKKARMIAIDRGKDQAEYISEILRTVIERDWAKLLRKTGDDA